ncbi:MAG: hypothetical protein U5L96_19040 [Owenweeksia sp.]|nr:hypothetical protein [Owenweeksia sp.]
MKLINFYSSKQLNSLLEQMGAELKKMETPNSWEGIDDTKLAELLKTGEVEIELDEIKTRDGVFEYKGRKVIVYIRDQYSKYYSRGYKFHLTKCNTISKAFQNRRNSRYVVSLRTDGQFKINLLEDNIIVRKDLVEPLNVCKNCLEQINYKRYKVHPYRIKQDIYQGFELTEYFNQFKHSSLNTGLFRNANNAPLNVYNKNFDLKSRTVRAKRNYECQECGIDMSKQEHRKFAHVHHRDGDKSNDNPQNLEVLCIGCHSNQHGHERLRYSPDYRDFTMRKQNREF